MEPSQETDTDRETQTEQQNTEPGDESADDDRDTEFYQLIEQIQSTYHFYITNPATSEFVSYSVWMQAEDGFEYPVLTRTGPLTTFQSRSKHRGDAIPISEECVLSIAYGYHDAMAFQQTDPDRLESDVIEMLYESPPPDQERWFIHMMVPYLCHNQPIEPEYRLFAELAGMVTEFPEPVVEADRVPRPDTGPGVESPTVDVEDPVETVRIPQSVAKTVAEILDDGLTNMPRWMESEEKVAAVVSLLEALPEHDEGYGEAPDIIEAHRK